MATEKPATKTETVKSAPAAKTAATPAAPAKAEAPAKADAPFKAEAPVKAEAKAADPVKAGAAAASKAEAVKPEPVKAVQKAAEPVKAEAPKAKAQATKKVAAAKPASKPKTVAAPAKTQAAVVAPVEVVDIETALAYPRDTIAIFSEISSEAADVAVGLNETFAGYVAMSFVLGFRHVEAVTGSRSFEDIYAANSDLLEAEFNAWLASSIATIEAGTRFVDKLSAPVEARLKKYSDEMLERMAG